MYHLDKKRVTKDFIQTLKAGHQVKIKGVQFRYMTSEQEFEFGGEMHEALETGVYFLLRGKNAGWSFACRAPDFNFSDYVGDMSEDEWRETAEAVGNRTPGLSF